MFTYLLTYLLKFRGWSLFRIFAGKNFRVTISKKDISDFNLTEGIDNHELTPLINPQAVNEVDQYYGSPSWMTFGFQTSYAFSEKWKLQGMIQNIFDEHYREFASGISAPGRNFSVSLVANL